jgi:hypothetical protein
MAFFLRLPTDSAFYPVHRCRLRLASTESFRAPACNNAGARVLGDDDDVLLHLNQRTVLSQRLFSVCRDISHLMDIMRETPQMTLPGLLRPKRRAYARGFEKYGALVTPIEVPAAGSREKGYR